MKTATKILILCLVLAATLTACGGGATTQADSNTKAQSSVGADLTGDAQNGQILFKRNCATCHGQSGEGVTGLSHDITTSDFIAGKTDAELVAFIKKGRPADSPDNTTGVTMPDSISDSMSFIRPTHRRTAGMRS